MSESKASLGEAASNWVGFDGKNNNREKTFSVSFTYWLFHQRLLDVKQALPTTVEVS